MPSVELIITARNRLQTAIGTLEDAHKTWGECVTALHMAELHLKTAQRDMRLAYGVLCDSLNHHA